MIKRPLKEWGMQNEAAGEIALRAPDRWATCGWLLAVSEGHHTLSCIESPHRVSGHAHFLNIETVLMTLFLCVINVQLKSHFFDTIPPRKNINEKTGCFYISLPHYQFSVCPAHIIAPSTITLMHWRAEATVSIQDTPVTQSKTQIEVSALLWRTSDTSWVWTVPGLMEQFISWEQGLLLPIVSKPIACRMRRESAQWQHDINRHFLMYWCILTRSSLMHTKYMCDLSNKLLIRKHGC